MNRRDFIKGVLALPIVTSIPAVGNADDFNEDDVFITTIDGVRLESRRILTPKWIFHAMTPTKDGGLIRSDPVISEPEWIVHTRMYARIRTFGVVYGPRYTYIMTTAVQSARLGQDKPDEIPLDMFELISGAIDNAHKIPGFTPIEEHEGMDVIFAGYEGEYDFHRNKFTFRAMS